MNNRGKFIISLDFELLWGVRDKKEVKNYGSNILGVWDIIPQLLEAFEEHGVKATFATVGFLFATDKAQLLKFCPVHKPDYINKHLSPYNGYFDLIGNNESEDAYHYASGLIDIILKYPDHEIATHTFSHYYCLEKGQTVQEFREDILMAIEIAKEKGIVIKSLVFPRNQTNASYLEILRELQISSYRGNGRKWFYHAANGEKVRWTKRAFRLLDAYANISGQNCYKLEELAHQEPFNIPSSRLLRPYFHRLRYLENYRLRRIQNSMTHAAKYKEMYHLWWHPHNFGTNQRENLQFLEKILQHFVWLKAEYGFESLTMKDLAEDLKVMSSDE